MTQGSEISPAEWNAFLAASPSAHLLQSAEWGELKAEFGWRARRVIVAGAGAQILFRSAIPGFSLAYLPKGPVGPDWETLWPAVDTICRQERAIFLKVEPDLWMDSQVDGCLPGFRLSPHLIQPPRTVLVSLDGDEDQLLERMKQKTRYNIRLAQKKGVTVRPSDDLDEFHRLMLTTGQRDGFPVHNLAYYRRAYELFAAREECALLMAEYEGQPLAGLMIFRHGPRAWYLYGASSDLERNRMPTYLLQWEAMRWAKQRSCLEYDLWGIPDADEDALENEFSNRADGLWGVYRFKRGFGGAVRRSVGAWDRVYQPLLYRAYLWWAARRNTGE